METSRLKAVVKRATRGDRAAAGELFDHFHPRVYRYAMSKLKNEQEAEDVAAETFAKVLRDLDGFKWRGGGFEPWIFRIASNLVNDHFRRSAREQPRDEALFSDAPSTDASPEEMAALGESIEEMQVLIERLTADQQEVLSLRFAGGLDTEETARVMGRKTNAVRQLQFRALETLRQRLQT